FLNNTQTPDVEIGAGSGAAQQRFCDKTVAIGFVIQVLTVEHGVTESEPFATQTSLDIPSVGVAAEVSGVKRAVVDQGEQAGGDILNVDTSLEVAKGFVVEGTHVVVGDLIVADGCSELDPAEFPGVASC